MDAVRDDSNDTPRDAGREGMAKQILEFCKTDPLPKGLFVGK